MSAHEGPRAGSTLPTGRSRWAVALALLLALGSLVALPAPAAEAATRTGLLVFNPHPMPQVASYTGLAGELGEPLTLATALPDAAALDGVAIVHLPPQIAQLDPADEAALAGYVAGGGLLVTEAEYVSWIADSGIGAQNHLLTALGAGITNVGGTWDCGWQTTTDVLPDPLTVGVGTIGFGCQSEVTATGTARLLVRGPSHKGLIAAEAVGSGLVVAVADTNVWGDWGDFSQGDNAVLAVNLANPSLVTCAEPADIALTASAAAGSVVPGENTGVTVTLANRGACPVWGAQVAIDAAGTLAGHLQVVSGLPSSGSFAPADRLWRSGLVPAGGSATLSLLVGPDVTTPYGGGEVRAAVVDPGYPADPDTVDHGAAASLSVVEPEPGGIAGTVRFAGAPAEGVHVVLYRLSPLWSAVGHRVTDADGSYAFGDLAPGSYRVRFRDLRGRYADGWWGGTLRSFTQQQAAAVGVVAGTVTTHDLDLQVRPTGAINGVVTDAVGAPVPRVWVQVHLIPHRAPCGCSTDGYDGFVTGTVARPDGTYHLGGLEPGTYWVRFVDLDAVHPPFWHHSAPSAYEPPSQAVWVDGTTPARLTDRAPA